MPETQKKFSRFARIKDALKDMSALVSIGIFQILALGPKDCVLVESCQIRA